MPHFGEKKDEAVEPRAVRALTITASPYTFTAPSGGTLVIAGGSISIIQLIRRGVTTTIGLMDGSFPMEARDQIRITYLLPPTSLLWIPS